MTLLDREVILSGLAEELAASRGGDGRIALVTGEAGIGKTAVVNAFLAQQVNAVRVAVGHCDPLSVPRTMGPIRDIAAVMMVPYDHGSELLAELRARPTVVVIEDAHWADGATLDFLVFAWRRLDRGPRLWIVTFRPDEVGPGHPLRLALGRTATAHPRRLAVPPLTAPSIATLARGSGLDPAELLRITRGNSFYVTESVASGLGTVPPTVVDSVLARAATLTPEGRRALDAAAVFPVGTTYGVLVSMVGGVIGIDESIDAHILELEDGRLRFRHEIARRALLQELPERRRQALHGSALTSLERLAALDDTEGVGTSADRDDLEAAGTVSGVDIAELAFHAVEAHRPVAVTRYCLLAGHQALSASSNRAAAQHFHDALASGEPLDPERRAVALESLGRAAANVGDMEQATRVYQEAADIWARTGDAAREGQAKVSAASHLWSSGRGPQARAAIDEAVGSLEEVGGPALASAYAQQAVLRMLARDRSGALHSGAMAVALGESVGTDATLARAHNAIGTVLWFVRPDDAEPALEVSLTYARKADDPKLVASAMVNLGSGAGEVKRYDVAERWLDEAITWCDQHDLDSSGDYARAWKGRVALECGRWNEAAGLAHRVLKVPAVAIARMVALTVLGLVRARRGDSDSDGLLGEAWDMAVASGDLQRLWPVAVARAEASWWAQGTVTNLDELAQTLRLAVSLGHSWAVGELAWWARQGGAEDAPPPGAEPVYAAAIRGDLQDAAQGWLDLGCPFESALALSLTGREDAVRRSLDMFESLGAVPAARRARAELRRLGATSIPRGSRPSTSSDPAGLTAREAEVLELVHRGLSNTAIAAELVISPRTVDRHVSALLGKLGVSTRQAAAAMWEQRDLNRSTSQGGPNMGGR